MTLSFLNSVSENLRLNLWAANPINEDEERIELKEIFTMVECKPEEPDFEIIVNPSPPLFSWRNSREKRYLHSVLALRNVSLKGKKLSSYSFADIGQLDSFSSKLKNVFKWVLDPCEDAHHYRKNIYPSVLLALRELVVSSVINPSSFPEDASVVKNLCKEHFFASIQDSEVGESYVENLLGELGFTEELLDPYELDSLLQKVFANRPSPIIMSDLGRRLSANLAILPWDPTQYSVRSHMATLDLENGQKVELLRTACTVIGRAGSPEIDPLLLGYLLGLDKEECHVYINNLSYDSKTDKRLNNPFTAPQAHLEWLRSEILKELSVNLKYSDRFKFISLPHDSLFYSQSKSSEIMDTSVFIQEFVENVSKNNSGFYFPDSIDKAKLAHDFTVQLEEIVDAYFGGASELTQSDRKVMINIAYAYLTEYCLKVFKATSANITCKDGVDRAMGLVVCLLVKLNPSLPVSKILYHLCQSATLNHAREPKLSRTKRSLAAVNKMRQAHLVRNK
ncbi:MAG: hypothetical protein S4CHLAM7_04210 [Chlamydiae bacterium]|nr:hypothetical protein [Chlamydiota bacterium]